MNEVRYLEVNSNEEGQRLDNYLLRVLKGVPKSHIYRIIRGGEVRVNKKRAKAGNRLSSGDSIRIPPIRLTQEKNIQVGDHLAQRLQHCIIHEDDHLLVVNKPSGIAVHGGSGLSLGMIEALRKLRPDVSYLELVHRLDKETSGCLLLAKKRSMLRAIQAQLEARKVEKIYWALLDQSWSGSKTVVVDVPLEKNILKSGERIVVPDVQGKPSQTHFKLLENYSNACWVEAKPKTGRTHQIRVHGAYLHHPIIGDEKYGTSTIINGVDVSKRRLFLHARAIQFNVQDKRYRFEAELDEKFSETIEFLKTERFQ